MDTILSVETVRVMIGHCRQTFGAPTVPDQRVPLLDQVILFPAETPAKFTELAAWQHAKRMLDTVGPLMSGPYSVNRSKVYATEQQWRDLLFGVTHPELPQKLEPVPNVGCLPPDYGTEGPPFPGRTVRLHLPEGDVPATVSQLVGQNGGCLLTYDAMPLDAHRYSTFLALKGPHSVRRLGCYAEFGHEPKSGTWDYWPRQ